MRIHTNKLEHGDIMSAVYGPRVPVFNARHVDADGTPRDWCGKSYAVPREARNDADTPVCVDGKRITWELDRMATARDGSAGIAGVHVDDLTAHGSRSHVRSLNLYLFGTSYHRPNGREYGPDEYAATWDEWGIVLARLFTVDPDAIVGSVKRPTYAGAAHFHWATDDRYRTLTPDAQHKRHRWTWGGDAGNATTGRVYSMHACEGCDAVMRRGAYGMPDTYGADGVRVGA